MNKVKWEKKFDSTIEIIDFQHRKLFSFFNNLVEAVEEFYKSPHNKDQMQLLVEITLDELLKYTQQHFRDEEELMRSVGYEKIFEHINHHDRLRIRVLELTNRYRREDLKSLDEIVNFLQEWVLNHIMVHDMDFVPLVKESNAGRIFEL